jgi:hypothetical protein
MTKKWMIAGVLLIVGLFFLAGAALAQGTPSVDWWVIGGGGGSASNGGTSLDGTIGQSAVASSENGTTHLDSGFWGGAVSGTDGVEIYLPFMVRQYR